MNRRNALKRTAVGFGAMGSLPYLTALLEGCGQKKEVYLPVNLLQEEYDTVWSIAETLLPPTLTPGASEAGVAPYFDQLFSGYLDEEASGELKEKLAAFMGQCMEQFTKSYDQLEMEQQSSFLQRQSEDPESFYHSIRGIALWAYYTSEVGAKSMNYRPVPGRYNGCTSVDEATRNLIGNRW